MEILITGGCGFIGVNLIAVLRAAGMAGTIRVLDNLSVGRRESLEDGGERTEDRRQTTEGGGQRTGGRGRTTGIELVVGDIRDGGLVRQVCAGMDVVVHLAANTGVIQSIENPKEDCENNVIGTLNCLEGARLAGVKRFVFASSGAPLGEQVPPIHEDMVARPVSPYGASKLAGEAYCSAYFNSFGLETVTLRFGNVYGPRSTHKGSVVAKFIKHILAEESLTIYGDGHQTRDFVYIGDLVDAILLAIRQPGIGGQVFQIATHREHTVFEVAELLNRFAEKYLGRKSPILFENERKGEVRRNFSDISKAKRMLGFEPKTALPDGLEKTFLWFMDQAAKNR